MGLFDRKKPAEVESSPRVQKKTEKSLDKQEKTNASRWVKGQSGNPAGRPKNEESVTHLIRELGTDIDPTSNETRAHALAKKLWEHVEKEGPGWRDLAIYLINRVDGTPRQSIEHTGNLTPTELKVELIDSNDSSTT